MVRTDTLPARPVALSAHAVARVLITLAALVLAYACWTGGQQPVIADGQGYHERGVIVANEGFLAAADELRPYVHPLFVALVVKAFGSDVESVHVGAWLLQVGILLAAGLLAARRVGAAWGSATVGTVFYGLTALNPLAQMLATELLTDLLAGALTLGAVVLSLGYSGQSRGTRLRDAGLSLYLAGLATETRPASVVMIVAVAAIWLVRAAWLRDVPRAAALVGALGLAAAIVPQVLLNWLAFGKPSPLVVGTGAYQTGLVWGLQFVKTLGWMSPQGLTLLLYTNPLRPPDVASLGEFARQAPLGLAGTFALHGLGMIDQDFGFTYIRDLDPWYRWPLTLWGYGVVALGLVGCTVGLRRGLAGGYRHLTFASGAIVLGALASASVYVPMAIDTRYGLPIFLLLAPGTAYALAGWGRLVAMRRLEPAAGWLVAFVALLTVCVDASSWLHGRAPALGDRAHAAAPVFLSATLVDAPPVVWPVGERQRYVVTFTNTGTLILFARGENYTYLESAITRSEDPTSPSLSSVRARLPRNLPPGASVDLDVIQEAPEEPGCYVLRHRVFADKWSRFPVDQVYRIAVTSSDDPPGARAACL